MNVSHVVPVTRYRKKLIKLTVKWVMPNSGRKILTEYLLQVPKQITPCFYAWVAGDKRTPYKIDCVIKRLKRK